MKSEEEKIDKKRVKKCEKVLAPLGGSLVHISVRARERPEENKKTKKQIIKEIREEKPWK